MADTTAQASWQRRLDFLADEPLADPSVYDLDRINPLVAQAMPEDVCRIFGVLPVSYADGVLTVATAQPADSLALRVAHAAADGRGFVAPLRVLVLAPDRLERAMDRVFGAGNGSMGRASFPVTS